MKEKNSIKKLALDYFDFFYGSAFGAEWNKMRLAMLTNNKYAALINNYSDLFKTKNDLQNLAAIDLFEFTFKKKLEMLEKADMPYEEKERLLNQLSELKIPAALKVYCYDNGNAQQFPAPVTDDNNLLS